MQKSNWLRNNENIPGRLNKDQSKNECVIPQFTTLCNANFSTSYNRILQTKQNGEGKKKYGCKMERKTFHD